MQNIGFANPEVAKQYSIFKLIIDRIIVDYLITFAQVQIFKKSLVLSSVAAGNIVNMVSNDCQKVADACTNLQYLWSAVCEIIGNLKIE